MGLSVTGLTKSYSGVIVLERVDFAVANGEIHALLGANGSGKSTLIKCVAGGVTPDGGTIEIGDQRFAALTPRVAQRAGVAVVYQELSVATSLSVTDNVFLGRELRRGPIVRRAVERRAVAEMVHRLGAELDPAAPVASLGNAERQVVEILKALCRRPRVLILDEPTSALTETEAERLGQHIRALKDNGLAIVYVTHRLTEVFAVADRVTVLRAGRVAASAATSAMTQDDLVTAIAGRVVSRSSRGVRRLAPATATAIRIESLVAPGIGPIDLEVRPGEILGVFGLVGSGRSELLEAIFGARRREQGRLWLRQLPFAPRSPAEAVAAGVALVPSDRLRKSLFGPLTAAENVLLARLRRHASGGLRRRRRERATFQAAASRLNLRPLRGGLEARRFSGGNQQKLVLGRWLGTAGDECHLLLLDEPTQGVDVGARRELYDTLRAFATDGRAVIVTSSEPDELLQLADRVAVLSRGKLVGLVPPAEISERRLLALAHVEESAEAATS